MEFTIEQLSKIIESADEVITALDGTNEDIHPEDSKKMCEAWDHLNDRAAPPQVVKRLAEIALATLTAPTEPVYQYRIRNGYNGQVTEWQTIRRDQVDFVLKAQPLNAEFQIIAPPAPVVPDEIRNRFRAEGLAELLKDARDYAPLTAGQWETLTKNWHQTFVGLSGEGDTCRAAMLQGAEPMQGWIPCSERMPEEVGRYWCYVEEQNSLGKSHYQWNCSWNGDRWWVESENGGRVTHWMPLPAAPQQEVK